MTDGSELTMKTGDPVDVGAISGDVTLFYALSNTTIVQVTVLFIKLTMHLSPTFCPRVLSCTT